jgi:DNA-binding PadR family transcriptional regulator
MPTDLLRGHLDRLLLAVLAEAPGHGYELSRRLTGRSGGEFDVNEGSLYPALHRLERGGHLRSSWADVAGRRRRVYAITAAGAKALAAQRKEWKQFASGMNTVLGASA